MIERRLRRLALEMLVVSTPSMVIVPSVINKRYSASSIEDFPLPWSAKYTGVVRMYVCTLEK